MEFNFSRNYFELFGLEEKFHFDGVKFAEQYQHLQSQYHPDRFVESNDQDKRVVMQAATYINEAYKTLKDEASRAKYLLQMHGVTFNVEQDTTRDMEFLMLQMNLREQIDEVSSQTDSLESLDTLEQQSRQEKTQLIEHFQKCIDGQRWDEAKDIVLKLQFFKRLQQQINQKQEALEDQLL